MNTTIALVVKAVLSFIALSTFIFVAIVAYDEWQFRRVNRAAADRRADVAGGTLGFSFNRQTTADAIRHMGVGR